MALDVFSTLPMSDEPERVFSEAGNLLSPRRRMMKGESVEMLSCMRSWAKSNIITLDQGKLQQAVKETSLDDDEVMTYDNDDLIYVDDDNRIIA
jgi:hypothetical protein